MKLLTGVLGVIAVFLALIFFKLGQVQSSLELSSQNTQSIVASNQALIASMQKLGANFDSLRQEIADFREKLMKK